MRASQVADHRSPITDEDVQVTNSVKTIRILRPHVLWLVQHGLLPIGLYFAGFAALTFPLLRDFSTRFFFFPSSRDGLQTAWNLWWVDQAVRHPELYPSIWHTNLL